ncbi:MAG: class I SAM-dependent methyltransferase [Verrucomicrobia bacterium]|nr:class I SAM-dependent methyltransferase [Verrucomicrobiota bacterium]
MGNTTTTLELYTGGGYLEKNPFWHMEESPWKAKHVMRMLNRQRIVPKTICEVGCGAGEVLKQLQQRLTEDCELLGCDISPQAIELCRSRANEKLHFLLGDVTKMPDKLFDLILVLDVIEHLEDYFSFLRDIKERACYKIFQIPLDLSVQTVLRATPLIRDRQRYGHIHYFNKETALQLLIDLGYQIIDYFYTAVALDLLSINFKNLVMRVPRRLAALVNMDLAVRLLGGYRLLILTR